MVKAACWQSFSSLENSRDKQIFVSALHKFKNHIESVFSFFLFSLKGVDLSFKPTSLQNKKKA